MFGYHRCDCTPLTTGGQPSGEITDVTPPIRSTIAERVREVRGELSQAAFARKAGLSTGAIGNIESGQREGSAETLLRIAIAANVRVEWLITGQGDRHAPSGAAPRAPTIDQALPIVLDTLANLPGVRWAMIRGAIDHLISHPEDRDEVLAQLETSLAEPVAPSGKRRAANQ